MSCDNFSNPDISWILAVILTRYAASFLAILLLHVISMQLRLNQSKTQNCHATHI